MKYSQNHRHNGDDHNGRPGSEEAAAEDTLDRNILGNHRRNVAAAAADMDMPTVEAADRGSHLAEVEQTDTPPEEGIPFRTLIEQNNYNKIRQENTEFRSN
ncbi:tRNA/tmRNA (uracil-C(5))-methyltransferase [Striga asiatica]|uniref:tRNA/tmRNA (Uracil-C(5))-methyltransferase n=1 Tax=Striga asiatica TaxID=4170 RepID=A0A5A7Q1Z9_STRAF|nr:tRNA/tmRNA (uracil-C(5))-methyltransferase [Striga asiatica]